MKWISLLAKMFYCIIVALLLVLMKRKLGLHNHFYIGIVVMTFIAIITRIATKGVDKYGK